MQNFATLFSTILSNIAQFLMAEPMCYFIGIFVLAFVIGLVCRLCHIT